MIPVNYIEWKNCITNKCEINLTADFVSTRLSALSNSNTKESLNFKKLYGEQHYINILLWLNQAQNEL